MRGKMREAEVDLMIQRAIRVAAWIPVNKCTCRKQHRCKSRLLFDRHNDLQIQGPLFDTFQKAALLK